MKKKLLSLLLALCLVAGLVPTAVFAATITATVEGGTFMVDPGNDEHYVKLNLPSGVTVGEVGNTSFSNMTDYNFDDDNNVSHTVNVESVSTAQGSSTVKIVFDKTDLTNLVAGEYTIIFPVEWFEFDGVSFGAVTATMTISSGVTPPADNLSISNIGFEIVDGKVVLKTTFTGGTVTNSSGYNYKITDSTGNEEFSVSSHQAEDNVSNNVLTSSFMNYADADMYATVNYNNVAMRVYQDHETAAFDEGMIADVQYTKLNSPTNAVNLTVVPQRSNTALTPTISGDNVTFSTLANQSVEIYAKSTNTTPIFSGLLDANGMATITNSSFTGAFENSALIAVFTASENLGAYTQNITSYTISSGSVTPPTGTVLNGNFNIDADTGAYSLNLGLPSGVTVTSNINAVSGITFKTASGSNLATDAYAQAGWNDIEITFDKTNFAIGEYTITVPKALLTGATADVTCVFNVTQERIDDAERYVDESIIHEYLRNTYSYDFSDGSGTLPSGFTQSAFLTELNNTAQYGTTVTYLGTPTYTAPTETTQGSFSATIRLTNGTKTSTTAIDFGVEKVPAIPAHTLTWNTANLATNGVAKNFGDANFTEAATSTTATGVNAISYESSETSVATVNASTGAVTIVGAGRATITATAAAVAGQYRETSITYTLTVSAKALADSMLTINPTSYTFTGSAIRPTFTVSDNGTTLAENTDYTVSVTNNINVGSTATVTVTGTSNYTGTATKTFSITKKEPPVANPTKVDSVAYSNTDEQVVDLSDVIPVDAGTISLINVIKPADASGALIGTTSGDTAYKSAKYSLVNNLTASSINETIELIANVQTQNYNMIAVSITVTLTDKANQDNFGFAADTKTVTYGDADYSLAASGEVTGSTVTYKSSVPTVATVDPATGAITILKAGSTVITATAGLTADYNEASDSYTLTVNQAPLTITAPTISIYEGDDIPTTLTLLYSGFVKGESETVFSPAPKASTAANKDLPGDYNITVIDVPNDSNYDISVVEGTLTVIDRVSSVLPPQMDIADDITSTEPVIALGSGVTTFKDTNGNDIPAPSVSDMRIAMSSAVSTPDLSSLTSGLNDPNAGTQRVFLELSLLANDVEVLPQGQVEIFIPYSKLFATPAINQNSKVKLLHLMSNNTYETIIPEMLPNGLRFTANGLSPFVLYNVVTPVTTPTTDGSAIAPLTGVDNLGEVEDSNAPLFVALMLVLALGTGTVFTFRKKLIPTRKR